MADPVAMRNYLALKKKSYDVRFSLENTDYTAIEVIGTGAYGVVCSAIKNKTKQKVAIKKIPEIFDRLIIAKRTYREIKILKHFKHDNIIAIRDILHPGDKPDDFKDVYIVLDLMESDLHRIIHSKQEITEEHVRFFTYQILRGLKYVHSANIMHRDLKPSNLLVNENCGLKIGDFGMARGMSNKEDDYSMVMTQYVATRWYRAPELIILPKETYNEAVDMWSVGCIVAEMIGRKQLFPGKSHLDQMKRIIEKLGTPSQEYLNMMSTDMITSFILKEGQIKGVSWSEVYPKASKKALDLLGKMLVLEPRKRITVNQALKHPFLSKYHDPDDEPICIPVFNFDFEKKNLTTEELKAAIMQEIMSYHKPKARIQFNFQPVPKSELSRVPSHHSESEPSKARAAESSSKKLLDHEVSQESSNSSKSDGSFERRHSELLQQLKDLQELQESSAPVKPEISDDAVFKKPEGFPLSVKAKEAIKYSTAEARSSGNDVEMHSARASGRPDSKDALNVSMKSGEVRDVEMISAGDKETKRAEVDLSLKATNGEQKILDTKELIRKKLAENERRKQREGVQPAKPKPVTAIEKQRERKEKRRQKLEKAKQRKNREKKAKSSDVELSEEDRKLLEKWQKMQEVAPQVGKSTAIEKAESVAVQNTESVTQSVANIILQPPETSVAASLIPGRRSLSEVSAQVQPSSSINLQSQVSVSSAITVALPVSHGPANNRSFTNAPNTIGIQPNSRTTAAHAEGTLSISGGTLNPNHVHLPVSEAQNNPVAFSNVAGSRTFLLNVSAPFSSYAPWPSVACSSTAEVRLPSYSEAVRAKTNHPEDWLGKSDGGAAPRAAVQSLPPAIVVKSLEQSPWVASSANEVKPEEDVISKTESDMRIITKQLKHSNVEDLTLTHTPKGTGGGYGVACDLDLIMECSGIEPKLDIKSDSAQLSPSLFTDWQELTGNIDPHDLESALSEYMMSPISSQEFNNVILSMMSPKASKNA